jgi:hypothetical protein
VSGRREGSRGLSDWPEAPARLHTDPFTLQYVAGHDNIKTTMRYVRPQANAVQQLFLRLANLRGSSSLCGESRGAESVQNPVQSQLPSRAVPVTN